jgi:hypothetical protein
MSTHIPDPPTRPSGETPHVPATAAPRAAGCHDSEPPPPLTVCWSCGTSAAAHSPLGWVTAALRTGTPAGDPHAFGICPACLGAWATHTNPYPDNPVAGEAVDHPGPGGGRG